MQRLAGGHTPAEQYFLIRAITRKSAVPTRSALLLGAAPANTHKVTSTRVDPGHQISLFCQAKSSYLAEGKVFRAQEGKLTLGTSHWRERDGCSLRRELVK